jgi:hypothetical protein
MEFLLQLFADFLGTPEEEQRVEETKEMVEEKKVETVSLSEEIREEEPVLFGLIGDSIYFSMKTSSLPKAEII